MFLLMSDQRFGFVFGQNSSLGRSFGFGLNFAQVEIIVYKVSERIIIY